jgi:hypothetical protein
MFNPVILTSVNRRKHLQKLVSERMNQVSFADFFVTAGVGIGIGLIMGMNGDMQSYLVCMTLAVTCIVTSFVIFLIPRFVRMFKKPAPSKSLGEYLARGTNREIPAMNVDSKLKLVEPDY